MIDAAIILAAGGSSRMGDAIPDKLAYPFLGKPALYYSIKAFLDSEIVDQLFITYRDDAQKETLIAYLENILPLATTWVKGGATRQDSVLLALEAMPENTNHVYIHDGARPLVTPQNLIQLKRKLAVHQAAVLAHKAVDTIKRVSPSGVWEHLDRSELWAMETPQAFHYTIILQSYQVAAKEKCAVTDDVAAADLLDITPQLVENKTANQKLTHPVDIPLIEQILQERHVNSSSL